MSKVKSTAFSRFIRDATEDEQRRLYMKVIKNADIRQKRLLKNARI